MVAVDPTTIRIDGVPQDRDAEFRQIADDQLVDLAGYVRETATGGTYVYAMRAPVESSMREDTVRQALQTIERRVDELGVAEPIVTPYGVGGYQILVQLPGVSNVARAKEIIRSTALLELKIVEEGPALTREALLQVRNGVVPPEMEVVLGLSDILNPGGASDTVYYLVRRVAAVTGRDLRTARPSLDEFNQPAVSFSFNRDGARKFGNFTGENIGRQLAVILDGRVQTAPQIQSRITDEGRITGNFTQQEAADLALVLRSGALPASLTYLEERTVGPTLGAESIRAGVAASVSGLIAVAVFMLVYYKLAGINAVVAVTMNLLILMGFHGVYRCRAHAPGDRGTDSDDRHRRRLERVDFRTYQGGITRGEGRESRGRGGVRPSLLDHSGHPRGVAHRGDVPFSVRVGADQRVCDHAGHRADFERLHCTFRLSNALRGSLVSSAGGHAEHLAG